MVEPQAAAATASTNGRAVADVRRPVGVGDAFLLGWTIAELQGRIRITALNEHLGIVKAAGDGAKIQ